MSQAREKAARMRAVEALDGVTTAESRHIYLREYRTSGSGTSTSLKGTLHKQFVKHHELETGQDLLEFFDTETGALVILPKQSPVIKGDVGGD